MNISGSTGVQHVYRVIWTPSPLFLQM